MAQSADRLLQPLYLFRAHWKALTNVGLDGHTSSDWVTRIFLVVVSLGLTATSGALGWHLRAATALASAVALLVGSSLSAFGMINTARAKLTERLDEAWLDVDRDGLDEAVAHLLVAVNLAIPDIALLVVGQNDGHTAGELGTAQTALALGLSSYIGLLFLLIVPKLYGSYVGANRVSPHMSGMVKTPNSAKTKLR